MKKPMAAELWSWRGMPSAVRLTTGRELIAGGLSLMVRGPLLYCLMYEPPGCAGTAIVCGGGQVSKRVIMGGLRVSDWAKVVVVNSVNNMIKYLVICGSKSIKISNLPVRSLNRYIKNPYSVTPKLLIFIDFAKLVFYFEKVNAQTLFPGFF